MGHYGPEKRALVRFDLSRVPTDAAVAAAWLQLYLSPKSGPREGSKLGLTAYAVLKSWHAGRGNGDRWRRNPAIDGEASWQCHAFPAKWAGAGCGEPGVDRSKAPVGESGPIRRRQCWVTVPLDKALVAGWIRDPKANHGLLLTHDGNCGHYHASEFGDPPMRPRLILAFTTMGKPAPFPTREGGPGRTP